MKTDIIYVEKKSGTNHTGDAWIGKCSYSKTGTSIYFNGHIFKKGQSVTGNYFDIESGEDYWISKVKKNGEDRHKFGTGKVNIDRLIIEDYLKIIGEDILPKNKFIVVDLNNVAAKEKSKEIENEKLEIEFGEGLRFTAKENLSNSELEQLLHYYRNLDYPSLHKKARKDFIDKMNELEIEYLERNSNLA